MYLLYFLMSSNKIRISSQIFIDGNILLKKKYLRKMADYDGLLQYFDNTSYPYQS